MKRVMITVDDYLYEFYKKVGVSACRIKPEKVMTDALFKLVGETAREIICEFVKEVRA